MKMVKYKCPNCDKEIDEKKVRRRIICPYCGSRIIMKTRPNTVKKVKAR